MMIEDLNIERNVKYLIVKALARHEGKLNLCAKSLEITPRTLYTKIQEYQIDVNIYQQNHS